MLNRLYEKVWSKFGGEPWTDKVRKEQAAEPLVFMLVFLMLGIVVKTLKYWWQVLLAFLVGVLIGHFWW